MKKIFCIIVVMLLSANAYCAEGNGYSAISKTSCSDEPISKTGHALDYKSPDGKKIIIVSANSDGETFTRLYTGKKFYEISLPNQCSEFLWAPDSQAIFINSSKGGAVGNYDVIVIKISMNGISKTNPIKLVRRDFKSTYPKCYQSEDPNFAGVNWIKDSKELLLIAQVLPHSNCDRMGTFSAYQVQIASGKILKKYSQLEAKRTFNSWIGAELRNADDQCFLKPGSCNIPDLHKPK